MPDKKENDKEEKKPDHTAGQPIETPEVPPIRSPGEQSVVDHIGPKVPKEGTRERELYDALPENIAKRQAEEAEKKAKKK